MNVKQFNWSLYKVMHFGKSILPSLAFLLFAIAPAFGQSQSSSWTVVRLADRVNGRLNCRSQPNLNAGVVGSFRHGSLVEIRDDEGSFIQVIGSAGAGPSECWVSRRYIYGLPSQIQGKIYPGNYRNLGPAQLNCRRAVGYSAPTSGTVYYMRAEIQAIGVGVDESGQTWLYTRDYCYVPALSDRLLWDGGGEDPNTMCNYLRESC